MERKKEEFCNLNQGEMSIHEYVSECNHLARYAEEEISTDARKQARFRKGLSPILRHDLNLLEFATFEDLVNRSFRAEHGNEVFEKSRKNALELAPSSSSRPQKRMIWIPNSLIHQNTHRGHPLCHLVHQLHQTTQLPALSLEPALDVASLVTTLVSVPSTKMLHPMPKENPLFVPNLPRRFPLLSHPPQKILDV